MKRKNEKFDRIISTGKKLFWKYGIKRVSVEEICQHSNVSKMTFYKYFKNKVDLACTILDGLVKEGVADYNKIMSSDDTFKNKLENIILLKIKYSENLSFEILNDLYSGNFPQLNNLMENASEKNLKFFRQDLKKAQDKGEIRKNLDLDFLMYILNKSTDIIKDKQLRAHFKSPQEMIRELVEFVFFGIVERN
ncbi:TetR/AcrR family transcriptional regulator [bacterium]|nr:TetR/AcrR family transcriptional regulator [bacterium]